MNHTDHVNLLRPTEIAPGGTWADLGSGTGAFTLALAELLGTKGVIYSIDRDRSALRQQQDSVRKQYPDTTVHYRNADFTQALDLPPLDGVIMANSLHFHRDKDSILKRVHGYLKSGGQLVLVEYNIDSGNTWVPFPMSFTTWENVTRRNGFAGTRLLARRPSRFLGEIYSAASHT